MSEMAAAAHKGAGKQQEMWERDLTETTNLELIVSFTTMRILAGIYEVGAEIVEAIEEKGTEDRKVEREEPC